MWILAGKRNFNAVDTTLWRAVEPISLSRHATVGSILAQPAQAGPRHDLVPAAFYRRPPIARQTAAEKGSYAFATSPFRCGKVS